MSSTASYALTESEFNQYQATKKLKQFARQPIDLTQNANLTPERLANFSIQAGGYKLLYGTERVTAEVMASLFDLSNEANALDKMEQMQSGEVVNCIEGFPSEERPALHTARDFLITRTREKMPWKRPGFADRD